MTKSKTPDAGLCSPAPAGSQSFFAEIASKGPQTFSAPEPEEAFETWWRKEFGGRMKGSKYIGKRAWYAAMREMGVTNDGTANDGGVGARPRGPKLPTSAWLFLRCRPLEECLQRLLKGSLVPSAECPITEDGVITRSLLGGPAFRKRSPGCIKGNRGRCTPACAPIVFLARRHGRKALEGRRSSCRFGFPTKTER